MLGKGPHPRYLCSISGAYLKPPPWRKHPPPRQMFHLARLVLGWPWWPAWQAVGRPGSFRFKGCNYEGHQPKPPNHALVKKGSKIKHSKFYLKNIKFFELLEVSQLKPANLSTLKKQKSHKKKDIDMTLTWHKMLKTPKMTFKWLLWHTDISTLREARGTNPIICQFFRACGCHWSAVYLYLKLMFIRSFWTVGWCHDIHRQSTTNQQNHSLVPIQLLYTEHTGIFQTCKKNCASSPNNYKTVHFTDLEDPGVILVSKHSFTLWICW